MAAKKSDPVRMYMVRGPQCLAPAYGIFYKKRHLVDTLNLKESPLSSGCKIVRVMVKEE